MGIFDSIANVFGIGNESKKEFGTTSNWTGPQTTTSKKLGEFFNQKIGQGSQPYYGATVAPLSSSEKASMQWLNNYMGQPTPKQYDWASTGLNKAINNNYPGSSIDPEAAKKLYSWAQSQATGPLQASQSKDIISDQATSDLFQRIKDQTLRELPELQNTLAKNANLSGMYFSGGHENLQGDLLKDTQANLLDTLANLRYSDEQARRDLEATREGRTYDTLANLLGTGYGQQYGDIQAKQAEGLTREERAYNAIPLALDVGNAQNNLALNKAAAGQAYGALPRTIQQAELDAKMQEFLRTLPENSPIIQQALAYLGQQGVQNTSGTTNVSGGGTTILNKLMPFT